VRPTLPYHHYTALHRELGGLRGLDYLVRHLERNKNERRPEEMHILVWDCGLGQVVFPLASLGYAVVGVAEDAAVLAKAKVAAADLGLANVEFRDKVPTEGEFDAIILDGSHGLRPFSLGQLGRLTAVCRPDASLLVWQAQAAGYTRKNIQAILRAGGWMVKDIQAAGSGLRRILNLFGRRRKRSNGSFHFLDRLDNWFAARICPCLADGWLMSARRFDSTKKIALQMIDSLNPGGAERLVLELAKRLPDDGYVTQVLAVLRGGELEQDFCAAGIPVKILGYRWPFALDAFWKIYSYLKLERPDVVHTHLFAADVYGRLAARLAGIKCIVGTEHNVNLDYGWFRRLGKRLANRFATALIAISDSVKLKMVEADGADMKKISLIPNGIDMARVIERPARHFRDIPRILALCRLNRQKDLATLLKALAMVKESWMLQIAGVGELEGELKALVRRLGLEARVEFLGYRADAPELLAQADIFCLPSRYEGQGLAVLEAAAAGVPLILSDLQVFHEFLKKDEAVFVEPGNVPAWAEALREVLRCPESYVARAQTAKHRLRGTFDIQLMAKAYAEVYGRVCPGRAAVKRRRVVHVLPSFYPGGAERLVFDLVKRLPAYGFDTEAVAVYGGGALEQDFRDAHLDFAVFERSGPFNVGAFFRLWRRFRKIKPDIVHVHLYGADIWGRLAAWAARVPLAISTEHNVNLDHGWPEITVKRLLVPLTDVYIAVSGMARDNMISREKLPAGKIVLIRNGVDMRRILPRPDGARHAPARFLSIGRLSEQKDQATLLRALADLDLPWELNLAGTGELEAGLKHLAESLGISDRVHFLGFRRDIGELFRAADVYISTSRWEGLALTTIEAAAAGVPCILPDIASSYEVLKEDEAEFAAPGDALGFSRAAERILGDYPAALSRAAAAADRVRRDLSIERMVADYADFYRTLETMRN